MSDYTNEMTRRRSMNNDEAERLLTGGRSSGSPELARLLRGLRAMWASEASTVDTPVLEQISLDAAAMTRHAVADPIGDPQRVSGPVLWMRQRVATVAAAVAVLVGSGAGVAVAANSAAPGDALYALDRALEAVGVGDGGAAERLDEVRSLVEAGELARGLVHAPEVVTADAAGESAAAGEAAREALNAAAERIRATASGRDADAIAELRSAVGDLVSYLADHNGAVDGRRVAELAQLIGDGVRNGEAQRDPGAPGRPADPGAPRP
jgi:hypothetical protein